MRLVTTILFGILLLQNPAAIASGGHGYQLKIDDVQEVLLAYSNNEEQKVAVSKLNRIVAHLKDRQARYKSEVAFVEYLYYYAHQKLLKKYTEYPTFAETVLNGRYDCLTATTTYSVLLSELSIEHNVIETNYHIYIIVFPGTENEALIETTDPLNGFIADQNKIISSRSQYYLDNYSDRNTLIDLGLSIERTLEQKELIGLLYYNQSIKELNSGHWEKAKLIADLALEFYKNTRVATLVSIIDTVEL